MYKVYKLICPNTLEVKYIGMCKNLKQRFQGHCNAIIGSDNHDKVNWVHNLRKEGKKPIMEVIAEFESQKEAAAFERQTINQYIQNGQKLFNYDSISKFMGNKPSGLKLERPEIIPMSKSEERALITNKITDNPTIPLIQIAKDFGWTFPTLNRRIKELGINHGRKSGMRKGQNRKPLVMSRKD